MAKRLILGLDLGVGSIGWALVKEDPENANNGEIVKMGVRINSLTTDEKKNFEEGKPITTNAQRTQARGMRRNLQRYKLRRANLIEILKKHHFINENSALAEDGKNSTFETWRLRAKAAKEEVSLEELARIFLLINKKRGYKSSRKAKNEEEGQAIDGMSVAKELYDNNLTPGQFAHEALKNGKKVIPDFYRSDLQAEWKKIWERQKEFYPQILTTELDEKLKGKNKSATWAICEEPFNISGIKLKEKGAEEKKKHYELRVKALSEQLDLELLAIVLQDINNDINSSSGYLGAISDRSKDLYFKQQSIGEYEYAELCRNRHYSIKNRVYYRQDYLDEFEKIWSVQSQFHKELTEDLKREIRDVIIFYQRKLKSQKGSLDFCQFESWKIPLRDEKGNILYYQGTNIPKTKIVGKRVIAKSNPLFQEFKIWQQINNLKISALSEEKEKEKGTALPQDIKKQLFEELSIKSKLTEREVLKIAGLKSKEWKTNYPDGLEGNKTNEKLFNVYKNIATAEGSQCEWNKKTAAEIKEEIKRTFQKAGINQDILTFKAQKGHEAQASYRLWHLLFSAEEDGNKISEEDKLCYGNSSVRLKKKLNEHFRFKPEYTKWLSNISFQPEYGNLSAKAILNILPYMQEGLRYDEACKKYNESENCKRTYNHSNSLTKAENEERPLLNTLPLLPKNSLRNPIVEKILNQMVNLVNELMAKYGKPDEARIELARELKKTAKERSEATSFINTRTKDNEKLRAILQKDFGIPNPTKNDILRYRLWEELAPIGYKELYTGKEIKRSQIFSKEIEIEHIIPKALVFDDSFSNKTLSFHSTNNAKSDRTAYDFIAETRPQDLEAYTSRVNLLCGNQKSNAKRRNLLTQEKDIENGFIDRDLRNSQYIAKKAQEMLKEAVRDVLATSGSITDKLREDWGLTRIMQELNFPKYKALNMTEKEGRLNIATGEIIEVEVIKDWTKRNDHRHHAMDALTIAFTSRGHIQYLNNLNARKNEFNALHKEILGLQKKLVQYNDGKRRFVSPMPNFRAEAKKQLEQILVSLKNKNKVVTKNINRTKASGQNNAQQCLTPRGELHKQTVYAKSKRLLTKPVKFSSKFLPEQTQFIANPEIAQLVWNHLEKYNFDSKKAFSAGALRKDPIAYRGENITEAQSFEEIFTIRKNITPDIKLNKVIDAKVREILQKRLEENDNDPKKAFANLEENPIWFNKEKGIAIKRTALLEDKQGIPIRHKKDHFGKPILDENGKKQPADYVQTHNNHHIAIYKDGKNKLQEKVVSFYEAVERAQQGLSVIDKNYKAEEGWQFLFTMKQNEMFVFPEEDFNPQEIDLTNPENRALISKHLYRVQKLSSKDYYFRHHLETTVDKDIMNVTFKRIQSLEKLRDIVKVRINHIGEIAQTGEY